MAAPSQAIVPMDAELLQAQADLWRHSLYYLTSMALKCAVELHIPTAIHDLGGSATLPDLVTALSLPKTKFPFLGRVMRLLVTSGIFASDGSSGDGVEAMYRLNPLSWLLVEGVESEDHTYQKYSCLEPAHGTTLRLGCLWLTGSGRICVSHCHRCSRIYMVCPSSMRDKAPRRRA
ncbi:unnamed protein product [Miscanthus lutarioriparius]|uniref:O-methyltransferase dimerisation domain-containing protein n=1 Tax=Miscanthus lutarioriparius TaxID=422564 RepID=A0A811QAC4_9POAL|nr:unnamed protein product [Miscanthus lutarioriparius]